MTIAQSPAQRVGNIEMTVREAPPTPENQEKFAHRAEALTKLLLGWWAEEQQTKREAA